MRERTRTCGAGGAYAAPVPRVKRTLDAIVGILVVITPPAVNLPVDIHKIRRNRD
mgnify:CR=1 FL=1